MLGRALWDHLAGTPNEVLEVQAVPCSQLGGESSACSVMKWRQPLPYRVCLPLSNGDLGAAPFCIQGFSDACVSRAY